MRKKYIDDDDDYDDDDDDNDDDDKMMTMNDDDSDDDDDDDQVKDPSFIKTPEDVLFSQNIGCGHYCYVLQKNPLKIIMMLIYIHLLGRGITEIALFIIINSIISISIMT